MLKLHDMNVDIPRPKLLAARRLGHVVAQRESLLAATSRVMTATTKDDAVSPFARQRALPGNTGGALQSGQTEKALSIAGTPPMAAAGADAPPLDASLMGMGLLPFVWYEGSVPDLELFGTTPLETDEVASAPDVST